MDFTFGYFLIAFFVLLAFYLWYDPTITTNFETGDLEFKYNGKDKRKTVVLIHNFKNYDNESY